MRVGELVQVITPFGKGYELHPGIISSLDGGNTAIRVFPNNGKTSYIIENIRHNDFRKENEPYWRYLYEEPEISLKKPKRSFFTKWF